MGINTIQVCIALLLSIIPGILALKLVRELYKQ